MRPPYSVEIEVAGDLAMFSRPDTGATPTSYPVPTWSAAKGIFEAIAFLSSGDAWIEPEKVEVCRRVGEAGGAIRYQRYTTNYGGPLRKSNLFRAGVMSGGSSMQLFATLLSDVCYRIHGIVRQRPSAARTNNAHYLQDLFNRRIVQGRTFRTPCLGWSELTCSYWGPFRSKVTDGGAENIVWKKRCERFRVPFEDVTEVDDSLDMGIPSMLHAMWNRPTTGRYSPAFEQGMQIDAGVLIYAQSSSNSGEA